MTSTWLPLNIGDYQKNTQRLNTEEHGAYLLLIMDYWMNGPIPNDKKTLKNITKISAKKLQNVLAFFEEKEGKLYHERIEADKIEAEENQRAKKERTAAATAARWPKTQSVTDNVTASPSSSPSPSPDKDTSVKQSENKYKTSNLSGGGADFLKNKFDIISELKDAEITAAKKVNTDWDFYGTLVPTFNKLIRSPAGKVPDKPFMAFTSWIKNYTKGKKP